MEEMYLKKSGFVALDSSELIEIRGGGSFEAFKQIVRLMGKLFGFAYEYLDDFRSGFEKGWDLITSVKQ